MVSVIHHPHDKLFRLAMEEPRVAQEFFMAHLPKTILQKIDLTQLKLENHSFVDSAYKATEADVIFSVPFDHTRAYLYLLCEQQSAIDPWIAFRLLVYRVRLMERHCKQYPSQPLPLIYPLVVYTGDQHWNAPLDIFPLFGEYYELAKEWFFNPAQLVELQQLSDENLRQRRWAGLVEFALKHRKVVDFKKFLDNFLPWIHSIEEAERPDFSLSRIVLKYVLNNTDAKGTDIFIQKIQYYLSSELREEIMTLAQQFTQQGMQQGIRQGIHQGIHQGEVAVIIKQLTLRFGAIPPVYLTRIQNADAKTLLLWSETILDAKTLEEVFIEV